MTRLIRQPIAVLAGFLVALVVTTVPKPAVSVHAGDSKTIYLDNGNPLPTAYNGPSALTEALASSSTLALSMASDDFDHDGVADLATGYSTPAGPVVVLRRGNLDAFAPRDLASFEAIGNSRFPSPFLTGAGVAGVADRPDFLAAGSFEDNGESDLIVASRGGRAIDVLRGDGKMGFQPGQTIATPGPISALRVLRRDAVAPHSRVFVGVRTETGPQLLIYTSSSSGLVLAQIITLGSDAADFQFGELDGDSVPDALILSGGAISILHGRDLQSAGSRIILDPIPVSFEVSAAALGIFVHSQDATLQIALLSTDGTVHLLASDGTGKPGRSPGTRIHQSQSGPLAWTEFESFAGVAPLNPAAPPLFFRTRISSNNSDDIMILNAAGRQTAVISHPNPVFGAQGAIPSGVVLTRSDSSAGASAALDMRVNVDGRPGVAFLTPAQIPVSVMMPLPDPVFVVNTTLDSVDVNPSDGACADASGRCSLRAAIMQANNDSGNDTIMVPAGTYTLTLTGPNKETSGETDAYGSLDIFHGVSIVGQTDGAGNPATIIQGGASTYTGIDKVFAINPNSASAFDTSFSNLQIQFGRNPGSYSGGLVLPHGFGGGLSWQGNLTGNLSLTNCVISDNTTLDGNGGGIALDSGGILGRFDGTGVVTISNSIIRRNSANQSSTGASGNGGGIWVNAGTALVMTNSQIVNNVATQFALGGGRGGGLFLGSPGNTHTQVDIVGGVISGNQASGAGAGIYTGQGIRIEQGALIANNSGAAQGGGLWTTSNGQITTISRSTIAGNSATSQGGGIFSGTAASSNQLFITFSRIANNTAPVGSNISAWVGSIDATLNWWGTNTPASTIDGVATFDPFIVLSNTATPAKILIHQTSTVTASFLQENHGNPISPLDLGTLVGLPLAFNPVLGTISQPQPESIDASGTATAVFTAGGVGGSAHVDAVFDNTVVTAGIIVLQPPSITEGIAPISVLPNTPATITLTITNGNSVAINANFADALPAGLLIASPPGLLNTCGGTLTAAAGSSAMNFANPSLPPGVCSITVNVASPVDGVFNNSLTIGSADASAGNTVTAQLTVITPPSIAKSFGASSASLNAPASLNFSISNPNANLSLSGLGFNDVLPAGMTVATTHRVNNTCGGALSALDGSGFVSLSGATIPPATSCAISVDVTGATPGVKNNTVSASSTNGGSSPASTASILVIAPPAIQQSFSAPTIPLGASAGLSFTIANANPSTTLTGIGFADTLPAGLVISTPNGLSTSCTGTLTATAATNVISLSGATLSPGASCAISLSVTGTSAGDQHNSTGPVGSNEGGAGAAVSALTSVVAPPSISAAFTPAAIGLKGTSALSFAIQNPAANTVALTGVAFTADLPSGLVIGSPNNLSSSCGGTVVAAPGSGSVALTSASIAPGASCTVTTMVSGAATGNYSVATTPVNSANGGVGNAASSHLSVQLADLTIAKSHTGNFTHGQNGATYSLTVSNIGPGPAYGTITVNDVMPPELTPVAMAGSGWNCTLASLTCTRTDGLMPGAAYPAIIVTVNVPYSAATSTINTATVSGGGELNLANDSASDTTVLNYAAPASITAFAGTPQTIVDSGSASPFQTLVVDAGGYGVPGVPVTFTATGGGAFSPGGGSATAMTDSRGFATSPAFVVSGGAGIYMVNATAPGVPKTAAFSVVLLSTNLSVSPSALTFQYNAGDPLPPAAQTITVGADIPFTAAVTVSPSGGWLAATLGTSTPVSASANVSVNPAGLAAGTYVGSVILNLGSRAITVGVTLTVVGQPTLVTSPASLTFAAVTGPGASTSQTLLLSSRYRNVAFSAASSVPWISVSANSSTTPATITVTVDPAAASGAASGTISGSVSGAVLISAGGTTNSPLSIPVSFTVSYAPSISTGGFENAASFQSGQGAPNTIMVLFGTFPCQSSAGVLVGGQSAEVLSTSTGSINFTLPGSVAGLTSTSVQVACNGQSSNTINIPIVPAAPGIFTLSMNGTGQGAVLNQDLSVNGPSNPASPGSYLAIYGTGFGAYATQEDGLDWLTANVQAFVGDKPATVAFAGHAPDFTMGLQQINVLIPPDAPAGPGVPIKLVVNGVATQSGVTVAIQ